MEKGKKRENAEKTAWTKKQRKIDAKVTKSSGVMRKKSVMTVVKKEKLRKKEEVSNVCSQHTQRSCRVNKREHMV